MIIRLSPVVRYHTWVGPTYYYPVTKSQWFGTTSGQVPHMFISVTRPSGLVPQWVGPTYRDKGSSPVVRYHKWVGPTHDYL